MRLTQRGVAVLATSPLFALAAWLFGLPEAAVLSVAAAVLLVAAAVWVKAHEAHLQIKRSALPARSRVGQPCSIQLSTRNLGRRRTAGMLLVEQVEGFGTMWFHLAPLRSAEQSIMSYTLPSRQRGQVVIAPTTVRVQDPFGLLSSDRVVGQATSILILPRLWSLSPLEATVGDQSQTATPPSTHSLSPAEEFAGLREYIAGDDLRRIHWPSTARAGRPILRQDEPLWQHRTTVLLDLRNTAGFDGEAFEQAVSAAASVIELAEQLDGPIQDGLIRLVTAAPQTRALLGTQFITASEELGFLHDRLALVEQRSASPSLLEMLQLLNAQDGGSLIMCTGSTSEAEIADLRHASKRFSSRVLLTTTKDDTERTRPAHSSPAHSSPSHSGWLHLSLAPGASLDQVWSKAQSSSLGSKP
jgi:hypothetical protein